MTYSETREMYTFFYAENEQKREARITKMLNAIKLLVCWLLPWSVVSAGIAGVYSLYNAKGVLLSFVILLLSFLFVLSSLKKERAYSVFAVIFSYLIAAASALTVLI